MTFRPHTVLGLAKEIWRVFTGAREDMSQTEYKRQMARINAFNDSIRLKRPMPPRPMPRTTS